MPFTSSNKILCIVGARPNFMKIAPIMRAFNRETVSLSAYLVHTGQHYDAAMSDQLFVQLAIPRPDEALEVGSASHAVQTAEVMKRFEPVLDRQHPKAILVVGDVNSTIACALVASKKSVPVIHVEAGLRSFDRTMPEEINRLLTDQIADVLFTTEKQALDNLINEGISAERVHFVGNVMIDTLLANVKKAVSAEKTLDLAPSIKARALTDGYALLTLHRPSNVDDPQVLQLLLDTLCRVSENIPMVFPVHPRTAQCIEQLGYHAVLAYAGIVCLPPLGYLELLGLMNTAKMVFTDSGGIQEETTALGVPCITLRENTERPITVSQGTNSIVGIDPIKIQATADDVLVAGGKRGRMPELWDGHAAERIVDVLEDIYGDRK